MPPRLLDLFESVDEDIYERVCCTWYTAKLLPLQHG